MRKWSETTTQWMAELRAAGASPGTIQLRRTHLAWLAREHPDPFEVTRADLIAFLGRPGWAPETRRSVRSSVRTFYGWASLEGPIDVDPAARLPKVRCPIAEPRPADDAVIRDAIGRAGQRELLLILLMAEAGLRRNEAARVHSRDLEPADRLRVRGKGGKVRTVPLTGQLWRALAAQPAGWVFPNGFGGPLTSAHVGVLLRRLLPTGTTPHRLRHAAASALVDLGAPLTDVRVFLGHASVATTQRYVAVRQDRLARVARAAARRFEAA